MFPLGSLRIAFVSIKQPGERMAKGRRSLLPVNEIAFRVFRPGKIRPAALSY